MACIIVASIASHCLTACLVDTGTPVPILQGPESQSRARWPGGYAIGRPCTNAASSDPQERASLVDKMERLNRLQGRAPTGLSGEQLDLVEEAVVTAEKLHQHVARQASHIVRCYTAPAALLL